MKYDMNDIDHISDFSESLRAVCDDIKAGVPKSRACEKHGVSLTMFNKIMHGLRKTTGQDCIAPPQNISSYKPWQDRLAADLGGDEDTYIPDDFESELDFLETTYLTESESEVLSAFYMNHLPVSMIAEQLNIAESTVNTRKISALRKLRKHRDELFHGKEYEDRLAELTVLREKHITEIRWISDAIDYLKDTDADAQIPIDETEVSDEAKTFFRTNGFSKIGDIMNVPLEDLFVKVTDVFDDEGAFLSVDSGISPDTPLSETGLLPKTVKALEWKNLHTISDVLKLSAIDAVKIPHVSAEQIVYIYRLVLFGDS